MIGSNYFGEMEKKTDSETAVRLSLNLPLEMPEIEEIHFVPYDYDRTMFVFS